MVKTTKIITQEIWVCDICGTEENHNLNKCAQCGKEICTTCSSCYDFVLTIWHGGIGKSYCISSDLHREGLSANYCPECATKLESELVRLGFRPFSYEINPT